MRASRRDVVAAAFAAAGPGARLGAIQAQVLLFLVDRVASDEIGGPFFDFKPDRYGPFDEAVFDVIGEMGAAGEMEVRAAWARRGYALTEAGMDRGERALASLPASVAEYFGRAARWVRLTPDRRMLAAIVRKYPEMGVNSVVRGEGRERADRGPHPFLWGMARAFDLTGTTHRYTDAEVGIEPDGEALRRIWGEVGQYLEDAMVQFGGEERLW